MSDDQFKEMCRAQDWFPEWVPKVGDLTDKGFIVAVYDGFCHIRTERGRMNFNFGVLTLYPDIKTMLGWLPEERGWRLSKGTMSNIYEFCVSVQFYNGSTEEIAVLKGVGRELGHTWDGKEWNNALV